MTYPTLSNYTIHGMDDVFVYFNTVTNNTFIPSFLFSFYIIILLTIFYAEMRRTGQGNIPVCLAASGFLTLLIAIIMRLAPGLVDTVTFGVTIGLAVLGAIALFFTE